MNIYSPTSEIFRPSTDCILTSYDVLFGKPINPMQRLDIMSANEFEELVTELAF